LPSITFDVYKLFQVFDVTMLNAADGPVTNVENIKLFLALILPATSNSATGLATLTPTPPPAVLKLILSPALLATLNSNMVSSLIPILAA
jgi:hypothetical protein